MRENKINFGNKKIFKKGFLEQKQKDISYRRY